MLQMRPMRESDFDEVAELIFLSTNSWYERNLGHSAFGGKPEGCRVFCEVYEDLDPGCAIVVENADSGRIVGSCFYHPREMHVSLGILNVHPNYFGAGVAGRLLGAIVDFAAERELPLRLVSSALNLDSYSLYNKWGLTPFAIYQDMIIDVPTVGLSKAENELPQVRPADPSDLVAMGQVEFEVAGISRESDYCYFVENSSGLWDCSVSLDETGEVDGFLVSIDHPTVRMIGPGVARTEAAAEALLRAQLDRFRGKTVIFLVPATAKGLTAAAYQLGARNCELHFAQVLGDAQPIAGVVMPTFLPESG